MRHTTTRATASFLAVVAAGALVAIPRLADAQTDRMRSPASVGTVAVPLGAPIDVQVYVPQIQAVAISKDLGRDAKEDRIFIRFGARTPDGVESGRLPRAIADDAVYPFNPGETMVRGTGLGWHSSVDLSAERPLLWTGRLKPGQVADFLVTVGEQVDEGGSGLKAGVVAGLDAAVKSETDAARKSALGTASTLATSLSDSKAEQLVGAFALRVANDRGTLTTTWVPVKSVISTQNQSETAAGVAKAEKAQAALIDVFDDKGAAYKLVAAARLGPKLPIRTHLGSAKDRCGDKFVVDGANGYYELGRSEDRWVPVRSTRVTWYCDGTAEAVSLPAGTNVVRVYHGTENDRFVYWIAYSERGTLPDYEPTTTRAKIGEAIDQCGADLVVVEGVDGYFHLRKGESRWLPRIHGSISWYCDTTRELVRVESSLINLMRATRDSQGRQITWEKYRETGSFASYPKPDSTRILIAREKDQCGESRLAVFGRGGFYTLAKGTDKWVPIDTTDLQWLCGTTRERTALPGLANLVKVVRSPSDRTIEWYAYSEAFGGKAALDKFVKPDADKLFLGTDIDQCGADVLTVIGKDRRVPVRKGKGADVAVGSTFRWFCGDSEESTSAPPGTNLVAVSRAPEGRQITWKSYIRP